MSYFEEIKANAGTNLNTSALALETGGNLATLTAKDFATQTTLAAMSTKLTDNTQKTQIVDSTGTSAKVEARVQTPTGNALNVQIGPGDIISNIPVVMDFAHHQCHEGESFGVQYYSIAPATIEFAINVPVFSPTINGPHMTMQLQTYGGACQLDLYEGATYTGGTIMTPYNRNRNNASLPSTVIRSGVTNVTTGVLLPHTFIAAATEKQGDTDRVSDEIVLKSNTVYRVVLEEITATTRVILHFEWYEDLSV